MTSQSTINQEEYTYIKVHTYARVHTYVKTVLMRTQDVYVCEVAYVCKDNTRTKGSVYVCEGAYVYQVAYVYEGVYVCQVAYVYQGVYVCQSGLRVISAEEQVYTFARCIRIQDNLSKGRRTTAVCGRVYVYLSELINSLLTFT